MQNKRVLAPEDLARPPRYATRRNPELRTRGGKIGVLAASMGRSLFPHQQYIADVATELNPPGSRLKFRYQTVVVSLPRQTGKTTLMRPVILERSLSSSRMESLMTAQKGKDATARWNDLVTDLEESEVFKQHMRLLRSKGSEKCIFPNQSLIAPFTPDKEGLHGYSPPLVQIDEGWAFSAEQGADLMRAIRPAQITKTDRQLWIISAAGDVTSEWWNALVAAGREAVADPHSKMAYFEWSADPSLDPMDPATWQFHPGLDGLITLDDLKEEAKPENNSHADFLRGFLNRSTDRQDNLVINLDDWDSKTVEYSEPVELHACHIAYEVALDNTASSVYASWIDDGVKHVVLVSTDEGSHWVTEFIKNLNSSPARPLSISADDGGSTRVVTDALRRAGVNVKTLTGSDMSTAWTAFKTDIANPHGVIRHDPSTTIRRQIEIAAESKNGDTVGLSRSRSLGPTDALRAAVVAAWQADRARASLQVW